MLEEKAVALPSKQERVEIDTSLPFESVKAAVSLFGEKVDLKRPKLVEKRKDVEVVQAQEELLKVKEQLQNAERAKINVLNDLEEAKKSLELITEEMKKADAINATREGTSDDVQSEDAAEQRKGLVGKQDVVSGIHLNLKNEEHTTSCGELESARQELALLKKDLSASIEEKNLVLKKAEKALFAIEENTKIADDLNRELAGINESLVLLKLACIEANRDKIALLETKQISLGPGSGVANESLLAKQELERESQLEHELAATMGEIRKLQAELASAKDNEMKALNASKEVLATLEALNLDIERTRMSEESATSSLKSLSGELKEAKETLKSELENIASLSLVLETLQADSEMMTKELTSVKEREVNATAAASVLTGELTKMRYELTEAETAAAKATEAISGLSQAFEQVKAEAAEAKAEADALHDEACKAKADAEQAEVARQNAESMLQAALQEADASKAAEAAAVERVKALSSKKNATRASEVEAGAGIAISQDEYESLKRKVQEAQDLATMRVAAAVAQVEAVRASEQEILWKVAMTSEDMESIKTATKQALVRADMAEAAKSAVEGELKRLREREQLRREKEMASHSQQQFMRNGDFLEVGREPLIETTSNLMARMSMEEDSTTFERTTMEKKKKRAFLNTLGSYLSKRKSFSSKLT